MDRSPRRLEKGGRNPPSGPNLQFAFFQVPELERNGQIGSEGFELRAKKCGVVGRFDVLND